MSDEKDRTCVKDFFESVNERVVPVGRLDYDTSGALIMSNDGEFINLITHPRHKIKKTYIAKISGKLEDRHLKILRSGVRIDNYKTAPAEVNIVKNKNKSSNTLVRLTIHEGKNRQIRRMFETLGYEVLKLKREAIGVLVIDDEERIRKLLIMYLEKEGYIVDEATNGQDGLERLKYMDYSCVLLDVHLPMLNGKTILAELRKTKATPVIIMSAQADEQSRVEGFELGADDYVIKPFSPRELMLRVNAILQRTKRSVFYTPELYTKDVLVFPGLIIDVNAHKVIVEDSEIFLTPKEFDLLLFLAKSPDKAFKRTEILRAVWDYDFYTDLRTVDTHIKRVRKKIDKISPKVAKMIITVWGISYKFDTTQNSL